MNQGIRPGPRPSTVDPTPLHLDARTLAVINTLAQMRQKVIQAHHHDIVDVTAAIGAAGRIHAITALMLLERIENELAGRAQLVRARQGPALLLCSVVDCFIGEGLGAMLAAAGARGIPMSGLQGELEDMEVKLTGVPEEHCCCGAWGAGLRRATRAATDTYIGEHSDMDSRTEDSASGIYDRIRMNGDTRTRLKRMLGTSTAEEDAIAHLIIIGDGGKETIVDRTMAANRPGAAATRSSGAAASVVEGAVRVAARNPAGKERDALTQIANLIHNTGEARTEAGTTPHEVDMAAIMQQLINDPRGGRDLIALKVEAATRSAQECTTCVRGTTVQTQSGHSRVLVNVNIAIPDTDVEESIRHLGRVIEEARRSVNNMFVGGTQQGAIMEALIETLAQANERALRHSNA
jgi:hypothetical protein